MAKKTHYCNVVSSAILSWKGMHIFLFLDYENFKAFMTRLKINIILIDSE